MRTLLLALALSLAACADAPQDAPADAASSDATAESGSVEAPTPGAMAPAFTLTAADGTSHTLADYRGQTVVLEWLNYDCPYVGKHYSSGTMQALQTDAAEDEVVWLSVVSSAPGEQGHFEPAQMMDRTATEGGRQLAVLLDPDGTVGRAYEAKTTPHMFVIDADGRVVYNGAIDDRPTSDVADLAGATAYVPMALSAASRGRAADPAATQPYGCSVKYANS